MRFALLLLASSMFLLSPAMAAETSYPNTDSMGDMADPNAHWYQACMAVKDVQMPAGDRPTAQQKKAAANCHAEEMYDDVKNSRDRTAADWRNVLACAAAEDDVSTLMMLYANGLGVPRNLPLAVKYACRTGGAPAEAEGRVDFLAAQGKDSKLSNFDLCDHVTSGLMQGFCTARWERQQAKLRDRQREQVASSFNTAELAEYRKLEKAAAVFAENRGDRETDASGTARAAMMIAATAEQKDAFLALLKTLEKDTAHRLPPYDATQTDQELNKQYQRIMSAKPQPDNDLDRLGYSTVTKTDVKVAQRSWLAYRDAWVRFARVRYPQLDGRSVAAYVTAQRVPQLRELAEEANP